VLGLRVVKAGTTEKAGVLACLIRTVLAPIDVVAGLVLFIVNERRRRVGDLLGGTEVVGLAAQPQSRVIAALSYFVVLSAFVFASSFNTGLILWAIFVPIGIGFLVVILGQRRLPQTWPWLAGIAFTLPAACYLSFASLCKRGEHHCTDTAAAHKAIPALIILVVAIGVVFLVRAAWAHIALAVLVAIAELYMFTRLHAAQDMKIASFFELILLAFSIFFEFGRRTARRRAAELEGLEAAAAAG
jgi:hypothetical protein